MTDAVQMTPTIENLEGGPKNLWVNGRINVNALRTNDTLRKEEWVELDTAVVDIARQRLTGIADLNAAGLVLRLGSIGTTISQYEKQSDMTDANVDMAGVTPGQEDRVTFELVSVPVPVIHKDFRVNIRHLEASRSLGQSIDVTQATVAARKVSDKLESILFDGDDGIVVNGNGLSGYTNDSARNTGTGSDWGTITNIYTDVNAMISDAEADNMFGPYVLYVAKTQFGQMRALYTDGAPESAYDRVLRGLGGPANLTAIKPADVLTAGECVLVQMTREVVDLAVAMDVSTIEWDNMGGLVKHFKVWAIMVPRIKSDKDGRSGIVHYTGI
jgi:uncharacterized linocin/CFP29 family protein